MFTLDDALVIGAAQGLLLCVVMLSLRPANRLANRLLCGYVALESLHLLFLHLTYSYGAEPPPALIRLMFGMRSLAGPALYLYVRALTDDGFRIEPRQVRHLWVVVFPLGWFAYMRRDPAWLALSTGELQQLPSTVVFSTYQSLVVIGYAFLARGQLDRHRQRLHQALSAVDSVSLRWLYWLVTCLAAGHLLHLTLDVLRTMGLLDAQPKLVVNLVLTILMIYLISIGGLRQTKVFTAPVREALAAIGPVLSPAGQAARERAKYLKSGLDDARKERIWRQLGELLERERPYLNATLSLPQLARQVGVRPQELSEVINTQYGGSFYDLINRSRIEAAKALLLDGNARPRKMLDIALSVGFSSQSTFYSQFKKLTGLTPTAFRDAHPQVVDRAIKPELTSQPTP